MRVRLSILLCLIAASASGQKFMAITVDDLPYQHNPTDTQAHRAINEKIVGYLTHAEVPAIGFVNESKLYLDGRLSSFQVQTLARWTESGLELGNHTFSHKDFNRTSNEDYFADVRNGEQITRQLMRARGDSLTYFRHPYLRRGNSMEKVRALEDFLRETKYVVAPVTLDNSEWIYARAFENAVTAGDTAMQRKLGESYLVYMMDKVKYWEQQAFGLFGRPIRQILLIHSNSLNAQYLGRLIETLADDGYRFISLCEALTDPAYQTEDRYDRGGGISWIHRWALTQARDKSFFDGEPLCPDFVQSYAGVRE